MKNKGFTLVELLGVIVLLGILGVVIIPKVGDSITNSKETAYITQEEQIKKAANDFLVDNTDLLEYNDTITIKLGVLKQKGYLPINIKNPKTRKNISNESSIIINKNGNSYDIKLNLIDLEDVTENIDNNSPILVLNGNYIEYVEVNDTYVEKGASAKSSTGETITNISKQIKLNNVEKSSIDTSQLLTYNIIYSVTDSNGLTTSATRTVIVRDTTAPSITFPTETTLYVNDVETFDVMNGVIATDNYTQNPVITVNSSLSKIPGKYIITYITKDTSNNETTERRVITVTDNFESLYTRIDYIESTGTQYIDSKYYATPNTGIEADFEFTDLTSQQRIFGIHTTDTNYLTYTMYINGNGQFAYGFKDGTGNWVTTNIQANKNRHVFKINVNPTYYALDNRAEVELSGTPTKNTKYGFYILAVANSDNLGIAYYAKAKLYSFKIYENGILVRNMIPCYRKSDNVAGLYDTLNNVFYTNSGTGDFIKGE